MESSKTYQIMEILTCPAQNVWIHHVWSTLEWVESGEREISEKTEGAVHAGGDEGLN